MIKITIKRKNGYKIELYGDKISKTGDKDYPYQLDNTHRLIKGACRHSSFRKEPDFMFDEEDYQNMTVE